MTEQSRLEAHLEQYAAHPVVRRVLAGKSTFRNELERFYDFQDWPETSSAATRAKEQNAESPRELVDILEPFDRTSSGGKTHRFNLEKLTYTAVRKDRKEYDRDSKRAVAILGTVVSAGIIGTIAYCVSNKTSIPAEQLFLGARDIFVGSVFAGMTAGSAWATISMIRSRGEYQEYSRLQYHAALADEFVDSM